MVDRERVRDAVCSAVDNLNKQLPPGVSLGKSPESSLYGNSSKLESLDFVTLIMEVEEKIKEGFGVDIMIADENLLSKEKSPFSTIGTLTEYLTDLLKDAGTTGADKPPTHS